MRQLVKEKENSEFKPVKLRLKIDHVSYPARAEGLVNIYTHRRLRRIKILISNRKNTNKKNANFSGLRRKIRQPSNII